MPPFGQLGKFAGGVAYPRMKGLPRKDISQIQMFKYWDWSHGSIPPVAVDFTPSAILPLRMSRNPSSVVSVLVIPVVLLPSGSVLANSNFIIGAPAIGANIDRILMVSALSLWKSALSIEIWLSITLSWRFCSSLFSLYTTWTTKGIR